MEAFLVQNPFISSLIRFLLFLCTFKDFNLLIQELSRRENLNFLKAVFSRIISESNVILTKELADFLETNLPS